MEWVFTQSIWKWKRFNNLTTTWNAIKKWRRYFEECLCDCWVIKYINRYELTSLHVFSCWCVWKKNIAKIARENFRTHWMRKTKIYRKYTKMKERCNNKKYQYYKDYWWRWIKCLWNSFEEFYKDMWESYEKHVLEYWEKDTTLDRINVDWNYCKENCKRSTQKEQANNRRNNKILLYKWKKYTLSELAKEVWLSVKCLSNRLRKWRNINRACEEALHKNSRSKE